MGTKVIKFMDTSFRDGFQSVFGARVFTEDFLPALEASVEAGLTHFEAGGGALPTNWNQITELNIAHQGKWSGMTNSF